MRPRPDTVYLTVPPSVTADYAGPGTAGTRSQDCEVVQLTDAVQDPNRGVTYLAKDAGGTREGTALDDVLLGGPGADTLRGRDGNDVLWGLRQAGLTSALPDVIDAGAGDDTVYGGPGPQRISGGDGDDFLEGGLGENVIRGGAGADTVRLRGGGTNVVRAGDGHDTIYARGPARVTLDCGKGHDVAHVDRADTVSRNCERVIGKPLRRTRATAPARVTATAAGEASTYAELVAGTPGLRHWWRLGKSELPASSYVQTGASADRITGSRGYYNTGVSPARGVTDDGDAAFEVGEHADVSMGVLDAVLRGDAFTFEG